MKRKPLRTVYTIAKALFLHHDFDPDVAVCAAHAYLHGTILIETSMGQLFYRLEQVKNVPEVGEEEALEIEQAYRQVKTGRS